MVKNFRAKDFYVETRKSHRVAGLILTDCSYASELRTPAHSHEHAFLGLVLRGAYTENYGRRSLTFGPSSLEYLPPSDAHRTHFHNAGGHIFRIELEPIWLERMREHSSVLAEPADFGGGETGRLAVKLFKEFRRMDSTSPLAIEGLMLEVLAATSRRVERSSGPPQPVWLKQAVELLHARFTERLMTSDVAEAVGVHPVYLARTFRKHYRCTVGDYVRRLRLEFASRRLASSDAPLVEIAFAAGFCAQSHFSEFFQRETGLTPKEYRAAFRTGQSR
jgi:AraC family transcriptional regulator